MEKRVGYVLIADEKKILGVFEDRGKAIAEQAKVEKCSWFKDIHKNTTIKETFIFKEVEEKEIHYLVKREIEARELTVRNVGDLRKIAYQMIADYQKKLKTINKDTLKYALYSNDLRELSDWLKTFSKATDDMRYEAFVNR